MYKIVIVIYLLQAFQIDCKRPKNKKKIDLIRNEASNCASIECIGDKAYSLKELATIEYHNDNLMSFASAYKNDLINRGIGTKTSIENVLESINEFNYTAFTSLHGKVHILFSKKNEDLLDFPVFHELVHLISGSNGISPNFSKYTNSFNEGVINYIAKYYALKHPTKINTSQIKYVYPSQTQNIQDITEMFQLEYTIPKIIFDENLQFSLNDKEIIFCLEEKKK